MKHFILVLVAITIVGGCGVHVGNGMKGFESDFGFQFQYPERLTLTATADGRNIRLDNAALIGSANDAPVSTATMVVEPALAVRNLEDVKAFAARRGESVEHFRTGNFGDAIGIFLEASEPAAYHSVAYVHTKVSAMVKIVVDAYEAGGGISDFKPIVHSIGGTGNYKRPEEVWGPRLEGMAGAAFFLESEKSDAAGVLVNDVVRIETMLPERGLYGLTDEGEAREKSRSAEEKTLVETSEPER